MHTRRYANFPWSQNHQGSGNLVGKPLPKPEISTNFQVLQSLIPKGLSKQREYSIFHQDSYNVFTHATVPQPRNNDSAVQGRPAGPNRMMVQAIVRHHYGKTSMEVNSILPKNINGSSLSELNSQQKRAVIDTEQNVRITAPITNVASFGLNEKITSINSHHIATMLALQLLKKR